MKNMFLAIAIAFTFTPLAVADSYPIEAAEAEALSFLMLVDQLKYQETYDESSQSPMKKIRPGELSVIT